MKKIMAIMGMLAMLVLPNLANGQGFLGIKMENLEAQQALMDSKLDEKLEATAIKAYQMEPENRIHQFVDEDNAEGLRAYIRECRMLGRRLPAAVAAKDSFCFAIKQGSIQTAKVLIDEGLSTKCKDNYYYRYMDAAQQEIFQYGLEKGAIHIADIEEWILLESRERYSEGLWFAILSADPSYIDKWYNKTSVRETLLTKFCLKEDMDEQLCALVHPDYFTDAEWKKLVANFDPSSNPHLDVVRK